MACKRRRGRAAAAVLLLCCTVSAAASAEPPVGTLHHILRTVTADGEKTALDNECTLGDAAADAARAASGADAAILPGGLFQANLQAGDCTWVDLETAIPEDEPLVMVSVTGAELREILRQGLSHVTLTEDRSIDRAASAYPGFPQISGLTVICDVSVPPEERLYSVKLNGEEVSDDARLTLCTARSMYEGAYGCSIQGRDAAELAWTVRGALADLIAAGETGSGRYERLDRLRLTGCTDDRLISTSPEAVILLLLALCALTLRRTIRERLKFRRSK